MLQASPTKAQPAVGTCANAEEIAELIGPLDADGVRSGISFQGGTVLPDSCTLDHEEGPSSGRYSHANLLYSLTFLKDLLSRFFHYLRRVHERHDKFIAIRLLGPRKKYRPQIYSSPFLTSPFLPTSILTRLFIYINNCKCNIYFARA